MILREIEISGFKSFASPVRLEFNHSIVAIVGPNGSGKSNIAEAFRFVLGEQSKKNLRSKKAEDLIWSGNEYKPRQNRASVSIIFDNKDKIFDIDFEQIKIERAIYRDGTSEYFINDSPAKLKDIVYLLSGAKLGSSSYHIISQGAADALLNASPKERLQIIKDALGLNKYIIKLQEAQKKLERTEENIKEVNLKIRELKPQLAFLESQIEKQKQIDLIKEELKKSYAFYIYLTEEVIKRKKRLIIDELRKLKTEYDAAKEALESFKTTNINTDSVLQNIQKLEKIREQFLGKILQIKQDLSAAKAKKDTILGLSKAKSSKRTSYDVSRDLLEDLLHFLKEVHSMNKEAIVLGASRLIRKIESVLHENENISNYESAAIIDELDKQIEHLNKELNEANTELDKINTQLKDLYEKQKEQRMNAAKREQKIIELTERKAKKMSEYRNKEIELVNVKNEENRLQKLFAEAQLKLGADFLRFFADLNAGRRKVEDKVDLPKIERLKYKLESLGVVDPEVIQEYKNLKDRINFLNSELEDTHRSKKDTELLILKLKQQIDKELNEGLKKVSLEFDRYFKMLFGGGFARLKLIQSKHNDQQEEHLEIDLQIPGKKLNSIDSLSGGERSLVSIALIFAISQVSPPPFIILDETDAALDEANSKRYSEILLSLAQNSQLITITHNRQTMSVAGALYGVTMGKDAVSQIVSITLDEAIQVAK